MVNETITEATFYPRLEILSNSPHTAMVLQSQADSAEVRDNFLVLRKLPDNFPDWTVTHNYHLNKHNKPSNILTDLLERKQQTTTLESS